jgi:hypothetical protein
MDNESTVKDAQLIIPEEIIPEVIPIIPISHRPIFPA